MSFLLVDAGAAVLAFFASLLPVLIWLTFWLLEDRKNPEPRQLILLAFLGGMAAVLIALPLEAAAASYVPMGLMLILIWAATEEILKFLFAWGTVLRLPTCDEPIDIPVYLITTALGFSSVENAFFLFSPIVGGRFFAFLASGDLRFIGATLIHVLATSVIGTALAFAYYRSRGTKMLYGIGGVILAVSLHTIFNSLILSTGAQSVLTVFLGIWVGIVFLLLAMERIKGIVRPRWWQQAFVKK